MTEQDYIQRSEALKGRLYRAAVLILGSASAAVDAVDEAVYKGFRAYKKLRQPEFFDTWLTRILINVCNTELRRRKRELSMPELPDTAQEQFDTLPLKEAVRCLPKDLREVIIMRYFAGHTLDETSKILDIPRGTVSSRQKKALELLRPDLTDYQKEEKV